MIKHIVINGGGPNGLISYGALKHLFINNYVNIENIKSIYGTSIGGIFGVVISLKYDWTTLDDYIMKRPWEKVFKLNPEDFFNLFYTKGLFSFNIAIGFLGKLLEAKELSINITLKEYYDYNGIDHHFFTVDVNTLKIIDLSHKSHPDLQLIKALEMTTAIPMLCKPVYWENNYYIDGGLVDNYPVKICLENEKCEKEEILGIRSKYSIKSNLNIQENINLIEYLQLLFGNIVKKLQQDTILEDYIPYEVKCYCDDELKNYTEWLSYLTEYEKRKKLITYGINCAEIFLKYQKHMKTESEKDEKKDEKEDEKEDEEVS